MTPTAVTAVAANSQVSGLLPHPLAGAAISCTRPLCDCIVITAQVSGRTLQLACLGPLCATRSAYPRSLASIVRSQRRAGPVPDRTQPIDDTTPIRLSNAGREERDIRHDPGLCFILLLDHIDREENGLRFCSSECLCQTHGCRKWKVYLTLRINKAGGFYGNLNLGSYRTRPRLPDSHFNVP